MVGVLPARPGSSVSHHPGFRLLWGARSAFQLGTHVTALAIPLAATLVLNASPMRMALLTGAYFVPWLVFGPFAGVLVDRSARSTVMIWTDLTRAGLLLTVPAAAAAGVLSFWHLALVSLLLGAGWVLSETASTAFLPSLLDSRDLAEGNAKLQASTAATNVVGPTAAGALVHAVTAPFALVAGALSFLASARLIRRIGMVESDVPAATGRNVGAELREGLRYLLRHRTLRTLAGFIGTSNVGAAMNGAVIVLFATRDLHLSAGQVGFVLSFLGIGGFGATLLTRRAARRFGVGPTMAASGACMGLGPVAISLVWGAPSTVIPLLATAYAVWGGGMAAYMVLAGALRQVVTPQRMLGRVMATTNAGINGIGPLGALAGGVLASVFGLRTALLVAGVIMLLAPAWIVLSPVVRLREMPFVEADSGHT